MEIDHTKPDNFGLIAQRLRARLDLANFKCQYGYQNMDLRSLESLIVQCTKSNHTTTNTIDSAAMKNHIRRIINTTSNYKHRYYPGTRPSALPTLTSSHRPIYKKSPKPGHTTPSLAYPGKPRAMASPTIAPCTLTQSSPPLSAKRSTYSSRTDELTAQLLLYMYHQNLTTDVA